MIPSDSVLLKIHRKFSHDEAVKVLEKELAAARFEVGVLKSEIAELKDTKGKKTAKQWKQDEYFKELKTILARTQKAKRELNLEMQKWRNRYLALLNQPSEIPQTKCTPH